MGRDGLTLTKPLVRVGISIHAPRMGRDDIRGAEAAHREKFQSTRPVWGATVKPKRAEARHCISIHAPRMGRDFLYTSLVLEKI